MKTEGEDEVQDDFYDSGMSGISSRRRKNRISGKMNSTLNIAGAFGIARCQYQVCCYKYLSKTHERSKCRR